MTRGELKKQAINDMLEALIKGNSSEAADQLHEYLQMKTRELFLGEGDDDDCDDDDKSDSDKSDSDDDKSDDDDDKSDSDDDNSMSDDEVKEAFAQPTDGAMSKAIKGKMKFDTNGKAKADKHGNSSRGLDDKIKGKMKFHGKGKSRGKFLEKPPKAKDFNDGRDMALGTTKS